jgi:predicted metal-binding protein
MKVRKFKILEQDVGWSSCDECYKSFKEGDEAVELYFEQIRVWLCSDCFKKLVKQIEKI